MSNVRLTQSPQKDVHTVSTPPMLNETLPLSLITETSRPTRKKRVSREEDVDKEEPPVVAREPSPPPPVAPHELVEESAPSAEEEEPRNCVSKEASADDREEDIVVLQSSDVDASRTVKELRDMCAARNLSIAGKKAELLARLKSAH